MNSLPTTRCRFSDFFSSENQLLHARSLIAAATQASALVASQATVIERLSSDRSKADRALGDAAENWDKLEKEKAAQTCEMAAMKRELAAMTRKAGTLGFQVKAFIKREKEREKVESGKEGAARMTAEP